MNPAAWLPLSALFPLLLAMLAPIPVVQRRLTLLPPVAAIPAVLAAFLVPIGSRIEMPQALLHAAWEMDETAAVFLAFSSLVWLLAGLHAVSYFDGHACAGAFVLPFLIAMSGNFLLISAADAVTFYAGFAVMSFASWGLVVHSLTEEARQAGRVYLALVVLGELLVLPGMASCALRSGGVGFAELRAAWHPGDEKGLPMALLFIGFSMKAGLFPFHFWLPMAHPVAPTPASAVLSGCMIKAGLLGILRMLPLGSLAMPELGRTVAVLALVGMVGAPILGVLQTKPKALLAYSSVAKSSLLLFLVSVVMRDPHLAPATLGSILRFAAFHGLHKCALFLSTAGWGRLGRAAWIPLLLLTASFAGLPGLPGSLAKNALAVLSPTVASIVGAFTLALMAQFLVLIQPRLRTAGANGLALVSLLALVAAFGYPTGFQSVWKTPDLSVAGGLVLAAGTMRWLGRHPGRLSGGDVFFLLPRIPRASLESVLRRIRHADMRLGGAPGGLSLLALILALVLILGIRT